MSVLSCLFRQLMGSLGMINMSEKQKKKKRPCGCRLAAQKCPFSACVWSGKNKQAATVCGHLCRTPSNTTRPPQPSSFFGCLTLIIFVLLQPARENFATHPSTSSRSAARRHGNGERGQWNGLSLWGRSPPPTSQLPPSFCFPSSGQ